jgi:hypothetical protein
LVVDLYFLECLHVNIILFFNIIPSMIFTIVAIVCNSYSLCDQYSRMMVAFIICKSLLNVDDTTIHMNILPNTNFNSLMGGGGDFV